MRFEATPAEAKWKWNSLAGPISLPRTIRPELIEEKEKIGAVYR